MPRPKKMRWVGWQPGVTHFKPQGIPLSILQICLLSVDELEALRLAHLLGYSQEEGAAAMNVSRATFGRILEQAHQKVTDALVTGKAIQIEGGVYQLQMPAGPPPGGPWRRGRGRGGGRGWRHGQRR
jgi:predicted DNA-binding protein (UPF0251 family)